MSLTAVIRDTLTKAAGLDRTFSPREAERLAQSAGSEPWAHIPRDYLENTGQKSVALAKVLGIIERQGSQDAGEVKIGRSDPPGALDPETAAKVTRHPWPLSKFAIMNTGPTYQRFDGYAYFHDGVDFKAPAGTPVVLPVAGTVRLLLTDVDVVGAAFNGRLDVVDDAGFSWIFAHIDVDSFPEAVRKAAATGGRLAAGTVVGRLGDWGAEQWPWAGETHHLHLGVVDPKGRIINPLLMLETVADHAPPSIGDISVAPRSTGKGSKSGGSNYTIHAEVSDTIDGRGIRVAPYELRFAVDGGPAKTVWRFDTLPGKSPDVSDPDSEPHTDHVHDYYVASKSQSDEHARRFVVDLGFQLTGHHEFPSAAGPHEIVVTAKDFFGNETSKRFSWTVP